MYQMQSESLDRLFDVILKLENGKTAIAFLKTFVLLRKWRIWHSGWMWR